MIEFEDAWRNTFEPSSYTENFTPSVDGFKCIPPGVLKFNHKSIQCHFPIPDRHRRHAPAVKILETVAWRCVWARCTAVYSGFRPPQHPLSHRAQTQRQATVSKIFTAGACRRCRSGIGKWHWIDLWLNLRTPGGIHLNLAVTQKTLHPRWTGSIIVVSWSPSGTSHQLNLKSCIIGNLKSQPWWLDSNNWVSGKPGAVHFNLANPEEID